MSGITCYHKLVNFKISSYTTDSHFIIYSQLFMIIVR